MQRTKNFVVGLLVLSIIACIHELGHLSIGLLFGFQVESFSIGFGKSLFSFEASDITYHLRLIPLGGYVKAEGVMDGPYLKAILFLIAGSSFNILSALLIGYLFFKEHLIDALGQLSYQCMAVSNAILLMFGMKRKFPQERYEIAPWKSRYRYINWNNLPGTRTTKAIRFFLIVSMDLAIINLIPLVSLLDGGKVLWLSINQFIPENISHTIMLILFLYSYFWYSFIKDGSGKKMFQLIFLKKNV